MRKINSTLVDKDVYELLEEIKRQLSTNWIYIHFDVLKAIEQCNCFENYENQKQLNADGSCTHIIRVAFKKWKNANLSIYIENCKLGEHTYYLIHSMNIGGEHIVPNPNPDGAIFFRT